MPVLLPTVAIKVEELVHTPPPVASDSVIVRPTHTSVGPVMAAGVRTTVTVAVV